MENVSPIIAPDKSLMLQHLDVLFGRALSGKIEITGISTGDVQPKTRTAMFGLDNLEAAVDFAAELNREQGRNVYVGAALRHEDTFPGKAADDSDFLRAYAVWADADDASQVESARSAYRAAGISPPYVVVTGRTPSKRSQFWWPLETPIEDIEALRALLRGVAKVLGTDPKVCTGKQLMRLAGTLNWPKKNDRVLERTEFVRVDSAAREFTEDQLHRAFPPLDRAEFSDAVQDVEIAHGGALGLDEKIMDGREGYAFKLVRAHLHELIGTTGAEPSVDELYRSVAPVYLKKVDQVRPGRGPEFLKQKCIEALRAFEAGQIPFMRDIDEAAQTYAERVREGGAHGPFEEVDGPEQPTMENDDDGPFRASDLRGDPPPRQWVVDDWIVKGAVNSLYGDGGLGKTLLVQQLACAVSIGEPWLGIPTSKGPVMAVLCEDDKDEIWRRHNDIKASMGYGVGNPFDDAWLWPRVGRDNVLIRWDKNGAPTLGVFHARLVERVIAERPSLLIIDTLADVYGGNEIDRPQVNYFVKTILGGLIKTLEADGHALTVLLVGHPSVAGKASGSGYSGSTAWNNAVRSRMYLTRPEEGSSDERILTRGKANYAKSGDETAIRLVYADGVLHAQEDAASGDSMLWAAREEAMRLVDRAWSGGRPFMQQQGHPRNIYAALPAEMKQAGFGPQITRQAIREALQEGLIAPSRTGDKRGYRSSKHGS